MWGIPEKSINNAAQERWIQFRRTFHSKVTTKSLAFTVLEKRLSLMWVFHGRKREENFEDLL